MLLASSRPAQIPWDNWYCCALAIFTTHDSVAPSETASLLEYRSQILSKTNKNKFHVEHWRILNWELHLASKFFSLVEISKIYRKKCTDRYFHRTNQTNQSYWFASKWNYQPIRTRRSDTDPTLQRLSGSPLLRRKIKRREIWRKTTGIRIYIYCLQSRFFVYTNRR